MSQFWKKLEERRAVGIGWFFVAAGVVVAWFTGGFGLVSRSGFSVTAGTNAARVSVEATHGTNHVFYYRGKVRWMWNTLCTRLGWRLGVDAGKRHCSTPEPADVLWVTCEHRGGPPTRHRFEALEVTVEGRKRTHTSTGGFCDKRRGVSVSNWALLGGLEKHRGSVIHIRHNGKEIARIHVR